MLFITLKDYSFGGRAKQIAYHVGEEFPLSNGYDVIDIQADGDELGYILHNFKNIPSGMNSVQIWRGDLARFIIDNWK